MKTVKLVTITGFIDENPDVIQIITWPKQIIIEVVCDDIVRIVINPHAVRTMIMIYHVRI